MGNEMNKASAYADLPYKERVKNYVNAHYNLYSVVAKDNAHTIADVMELLQNAQPPLSVQCAQALLTDISKLLPSVTVMKPTN